MQGKLPPQKARKPRLSFPRQASFPQWDKILKFSLYLYTFLYILDIYERRGVMLNFEQFIGFDWDDSNLKKNWKKHRVSHLECEQVFFNQPLLVFPDTQHSDQEERFYVLGRTDRGRRLFVVFTPRGNKIRVISAREMTKKERSFYPV